MKTFRIFGTGLLIAALLLVVPMNRSVQAREPESSIWESPLKLFQSIVSRADGQRCPMYPSCSHYAAQAVERYGRLKGWMLTGDRLLRCGRDETRLAPEVSVNGRRQIYDPLEDNTFWWGHR